MNPREMAEDKTPINVKKISAIRTNVLGSIRRTDPKENMSNKLSMRYILVERPKKRADAKKATLAFIFHSILNAVCEDRR